MKQKLLVLCFSTLALFITCATSGKIRVQGLVSLDEALAGAAAAVSSSVQEKTEIAVVGLYAPLSDISDFITDELLKHLVVSGKFNVVERNAATLAILNAEHQFQLSGLVNDESAVGIGHYLGVQVVITGSLCRFEGFSQLRLRAIDINSSQALTQFTALIRSNDTMLANIMRPLDNIKPSAITENTLAHLNRGVDFASAGKYDEAIQEFDRVLVINKDLAEAYFYRGIMFLAVGDYNRAVEDWTAAIRIRPDDADTLYNRGTVYANFNYYDLAFADINAALRIMPDMYEALFNRGNMYAQNSYYDLAIADYTAVIRIKPDFANALINRGAAYSAKNDYDRAIADYNSALRIKPESHEALSNRGIVYFHKSDYDRAIADYTAAIRIKPDYIDALNNRGLAYRDKGDIERAIAEWETVLRIDPDNFNAKRFIDAVRRQRGY